MAAGSSEVAGKAPQRQSGAEGVRHVTAGKRAARGQHVHRRCGRSLSLTVQQWWGGRGGGRDCSGQVQFRGGLCQPLEGERGPLQGFEQRKDMMELYFKRSALESGVFLHHGHPLSQDHPRTSAL